MEVTLCKLSFYFHILKATHTIVHSWESLHINNLIESFKSETKNTPNAPKHGFF